MICPHFGQCPSCSLPREYETQLELKLKELKLLGFTPHKIFKSPPQAYRSRAEFRIYKSNHTLSYALSGQKGIFPIEHCSILLPSLWHTLSKLLPILSSSACLSEKLFSLEILGNLEGEVLVVLLYHRSLDEAWEKEAKEIEKALNITLIARSRKEKKILSQDFLQDTLEFNGETFYFRRYDNTFSQPNPYINLEMLNFALSCVKRSETRQDLLELYCGSGNFTLPLSSSFKKVFATEINKASIKALHENIALNQKENIFCARLSGEESIEALSFQRDFFRLREVDLRSYHFSHILIDPPRSGVGDPKMLEFIAQFPNILYISCNPHTLQQDLHILQRTHTIKDFAVFDQFPYTPHLECGVWLKA